MDLSQLTGFLTGIAGAAAIVISALGRRRDTRAAQWDDVLRERNELQRKYDRVRRGYDALLDWAYDVRTSLHKRGIDVPDLPEPPEDNRS